MINTPDFNQAEKELILNISIQLIKHGYFTAFNLISSEMPLPTNSIIIHYLQDSTNQIQHITKKISEKFPYSEKEMLILPRLTFYNFDPQYSKKPNFEKNYCGAVFLDNKLKQCSMEEIIASPFNKMLYRNELDLLIPILPEVTLPDLAAFILSEDRSGPEPWIDPAIIIRSQTQYKDIAGFVKKDYCCIRRENSEFYTILFNETIKNQLEKVLNKICLQLKDAVEIKLSEDSVLFLRGDVNTALHEYIQRNLNPFKQLYP